MEKFNKVLPSSVFLWVIGFLFYAVEVLALPPYCSNVCDGDSYCNTSCTNDAGKAITCYQWGVCDPRSLVTTSILIDKAYPYAFPDPYGFGLRMEYKIALGKGHEAISVTTQYSPDSGVTWYTDEANRSPTYDWDNIHGNIECGLDKYNLLSNHPYTLRAILNYKDLSGTVHHLSSNLVTATVENYDPPVLYNNVGHIPEGVRIPWRNAGLLPSNRSGLLPETPIAAHVQFDVTTMPGASIDEKIAEALNRARREWNNFGRTSIIYFPPGRYPITSTIELREGDSNIIFQGAGTKDPNATFLECNVGKDGTCFYIHGSDAGFPVYDLNPGSARDLERGDRVIVGPLPRCPEGMTDPSCLAGGDWIHLWENAFPAQGGAVPGQITQLERVFSEITMKDEASKRYSTGYGLKVRKFRPVTNIGIENLKIYRLDTPKSTENQYGSGTNIKFEYAVNCWLRGVESELTCRHHVTVSASSHIEMSGCYFHRARFYGGNSYGYGIVMGESSTNCLIENNVFRRVRHAMGIGTGANSNVFTFNYSREQYSTYKILGKDIQYGDSDICLHGRYPYANLYEHNIVEQIEADDTHGDNGPYNAFVRNRSYERNIDLYNAPSSTVLGSDTRSPGVERHGKTSFALEGYGKSYLVGGKPAPYENAPWVSYFSGSFHYDPIGQGDNFSFLKDVSYFYTSRPYFLSGGYTWPTVGPEYENPYLMVLEGKYYRRISQTIPAEGRYKSGNETYISKLTQVRPPVPAPAAKAD